MKYAVKTLVRKAQKLDAGANLQILSYVLTLSYHQPLLLPHLDQLFKRAEEQGTFNSEAHRKKLNAIAFENARQRRSDGMCWSLYYLNKYELDINDKVANEIEESEDSLALLALYLSGNETHQERVIDFTKRVIAFAKKLDGKYAYALDEHWMLLYQLFLDDHIQRFSATLNH